jgi:thioredoxin-related protein
MEIDMHYVKQHYSVIAAVILTMMIFAAGCGKEAPVEAANSAGDGNHQHAEWITDFEKAKQTAQAQGKDLLIDFSGSDWCGWCIKLDKEVFSKEAFVHEAEKKFVLVLIDFPNDTSGQSQALQAQNERLSKQFSVEFFPTILLADSSGKPYATTGYQEGGPTAYLEHLKQLREENRP